MENWQKITTGTIATLLLCAIVIGVGTSQGKEVLNTGALEDGVYFGMVSHTEYMSGETGQIISRLVNWQGNPIDATCKATIKYPDKTAFITNQTMTESTVAGDFYINFTTPNIEGVYEYQSVCNYTIGSTPRESRATNSFHLSPALNIIKVINTTTLEINGTTYDILNDVRAINTTRTAFLEAMNLSVDTDLQTIIDNLNAQNYTDELTTLLNNQLAINLSIDSDLTQIYTDMLSINTSTAEDLADIYVDTQYIRTNMLSDEEFTNNISIVYDRLNEVSSNLTAIQGMCDDPVTNTSVLCTYVSYIKDNIGAGNSTYQALVTNYLEEINATTHSTYDYMTGTLTTNVANVQTAVDNIQTDVTTLLGRTLNIETTVNETNVIVNQVNDTVNDISTAQQEQVYLTVFSG